MVAKTGPGYLPQANLDLTVPHTPHLSLPNAKVTGVCTIMPGWGELLSWRKNILTDQSPRRQGDKTDIPQVHPRHQRNRCVRQGNKYSNLTVRKGKVALLSDSGLGQH